MSVSTAARGSQISRPRRFAPLDPQKTNTHDAPQLKGIIFDVDGTLCLPQNYMFREMRNMLNIPKSVDILEHVRSLSDTPDDEPTTETDSSNSGTAAETDGGSESSPRSRAVASIRAIESRAMTSQRPQPGLVELMTYLTSTRSVRKGLCTRNFPAPVHHLLDKFLPDQKETIAPIITRETVGIEPKPSPEGLWKIAMDWGLSEGIQVDPVNHKDGSRKYTGPSSGGNGSDEDKAKPADGADPNDPLVLAREHLGSGLIMVGDSLDDMEAGYRAGAATVLLVNEENEQLARHQYTDVGVRRLDDLIEILESGFEGRSD